MNSRALKAPVKHYEQFSRAQLAAMVDDYARVNAYMQERRGILRGMLRAMDEAAGPFSRCPECKRRRWRGHGKDCALGREIKA